MKTQREGGVGVDAGDSVTFIVEGNVVRVFIDTNILISAALFLNGVAAAAYEKACLRPVRPRGERLHGR